MGKATYSLHQDIQGRVSYPELIELMFGRKQWLSVKSRFNLQGENMVSQVYLGEARDLDDEQIGHISFSQIFLLKAEYFISKLFSVEAELTNGSHMSDLPTFLKVF